MFNAIFGTLFTKQVDGVEVDSTTMSEQELQAHNNSEDNRQHEASTQTNSKVVSKKGGPGPAKVKRSYSSVVSGSLKKRGNAENDWVIVDPSEEADKLKTTNYASTMTNNNEVDEEMDVVQSVQQHPAKAKQSLKRAATASNLDNEDIMLRSFFDRAEREGATDDEALKQGAFIRSVYNTDTETAKPADQWLITPLPCLTSIPSTQRSMVESGPRENLLIEQPDAFMKSTTSLSSASTATCTALVAVPNPTPAPSMRKMNMSYSSIVKSVAEKRVAEAEPTPVAAAIPLPAPEPKPVVATIVETVPVVVPAKPAVTVAPSPQLPTKKSAKKSKKNNGSGSPPLSRSHNKENSQQSQVKTLLLSDFKKNTATPRSEPAAANLKQMKRNNKNLFLSSSSSSLKQRKYHNLQQPAFSYPAQNF